MIRQSTHSHKFSHTGEFRGAVAKSFVVSYVFALGSLLLLPLMPSQPVGSKVSHSNNLKFPRCFPKIDAQEKIIEKVPKIIPDFARKLIVGVRHFLATGQKAMAQRRKREWGTSKAYGWITGE